jgi:hypothetical protein
LPPCTNEWVGAPVLDVVVLGSGHGTHLTGWSLLICRIVIRKSRCAQKRENPQRQVPMGVSRKNSWLLVAYTTPPPDT